MERRSERRSPAGSEPRRAVAALASAIFPGLGQAVNGRLRLARWLAIPIVVVAAAVILLAASRPANRLVAWMLDPDVMTLLLGVNIVVVAWRLVAVLQAFFDRRYRRVPGPGTAVALVVVLAVVALPHAILGSWGSHAQQAFAAVFADGPLDERGLVSAGPGDGERINILLIGVDARADRTATLADSIMVASIDPVRPSVSLASFPRDMVRVPIGDGQVYLAKINSLLGYGDRHPDEFPNGGMAAMKTAIGELLGMPIHYYVRTDFVGFVKMVDLLGGVDLDVKRAFYDPEYDRMGLENPDKRGWGVELGPHHFSGYEALAYARTRKGIGESDFTRAARQQEILLAIRSQVMADGSVLMRIPDLLDAFRDFVQTDMPPDRLPELAALSEEITEADIARRVVAKPLVKGKMDEAYGSVQVPDVAAIRAMAAILMPAPGEVPVAWPSKAPTAQP